MGDWVYGAVKVKKLAFYRVQHGESVNICESTSSWEQWGVSVSCV
jgi:hypothetical protein